MPTGPKQALFAEFARLGQTLANPSRLEILDFLAQSERSVQDLARLCGISVANASQHLQTLRAAGLVQTRKQGLQVFYSLAGSTVGELFRALRRCAELHLAEVDRIVRAHRAGAAAETVSLPELRRRLREGTAVLLDVRPPEEFAAGHIPGARNIPLSELRAQLRHLPDGVDIIAYCRGPYCFLSDEAVALLSKSGRRAIRSAEGFPEWKARGWKVASVPA
jgi:rhodanese-related sulfurtransferase/DNA-binding HxlR family transcriptional regulator